MPGHVKSFDPSPFVSGDGGTDYRIDGCDQICYHTDKEGCYVEQCTELLVTLDGLRCLNKKNRSFFEK